MPKTFGTKVKYEGITFDSKFECRVYKALRLFWGKGDIFCHEPWYIPMHRGRGIDSKYHQLVKQKAIRFDFLIPDAALIVEAKGRWMPEDYWKIASCLYGLPETQSFRVIQCNTPPTTWFDTKHPEHDKVFVSQRSFFRSVKSISQKEQLLSCLNINSQFEDKK